MSDEVKLRKRDLNRNGLPGWTYHSDSLFELEAEKIFRQHWQFVCHINELREDGSFKTIDRVGER